MECLGELHYTDKLYKFAFTYQVYAMCKVVSKGANLRYQCLYLLLEMLE